MPPEAPTVPCYKADLVSRLKGQMPPDEVLLRLGRLFGALSDPTRLKIVGALASGEELCVCDVANVVELSLSATSHQLRKLRDLGAVAHRSEGRMAYYRLCDPFLADLLSQARAELRAA